MENTTDIAVEGIPFRFLREIGRGAHGSVFLAEATGRRIAVKVCRKPDDPSRLDDWNREKRGWSLLARIPPHPGLVRVFGTGETPDGFAFWVAMEPADPEPGRSADDPAGYRPLTLASVAAAEVALPVRRCLAIGERLACALEHLQRHHLLHRDVKPGNVLFVRGKPVVADAGLVADDREAASLVGTPGYEPPEHHGTPRGDVFSLGRTLWCICTGRSPEEAGSAPRVEADTSDPDFRSFLDVVERATSDSEERRYQSAKALRNALVRLRRRRALRRLRRVLVPMLAAACLALLLALAWTLGRRPARPVPSAPPAETVSSEPDPLDFLREGIRSGKIHVMTPAEANKIVGRANAAVGQVRKVAEEALSARSEPGAGGDGANGRDVRRPEETRPSAEAAP